KKNPSTKDPDGKRFIDMDKLPHLLRNIDSVLVNLHSKTLRLSRLFWVLNE
ncbi:hypothetical protein AVEN_82498-1, partial [Araneus ventricosus]